MVNIRKDLIEKELSNCCADRIKFKQFTPTNKFIDWLFSKYKTKEFSIHFYDSEPDVPQEWDLGGDEWEDPEFLRIWEDIKKEYESQRIVLKNWIDPLSAGSLGMNQKQVDEIAKKKMECTLAYDVDIYTRSYVSFEKEGFVYLYWYGRDFVEYDFWWIMKKKQDSR